MEVTLSDEQPDQIMPRNRYFVLQRNRRASANIGKIGEMDIGKCRRRPMEQKKGRLEADPTS